MTSFEQGAQWMREQAATVCGEKAKKAHAVMLSKRPGSVLAKMYATGSEAYQYCSDAIRAIAIPQQPEGAEAREGKGRDDLLNTLSNMAASRWANLYEHNFVLEAAVERIKSQQDRITQLEASRAALSSLPPAQPESVMNERTALLNEIQLRYSEILVATREIGARGHWSGGSAVEFHIPRGTPFHDGTEKTLIDKLFDAVYGAEEQFKLLAAAPKNEDKL